MAAISVQREWLQPLGPACEEIHWQCMTHRGRPAVLLRVGEEIAVVPSLHFELVSNEMVEGITDDMCVAGAYPDGGGQGDMTRLTRMTREPSEKPLYSRGIATITACEQRGG